MLCWAKFIAISGCSPRATSQTHLAQRLHLEGLRRTFSPPSPDFGPLQKSSCAPVLTPLVTVSLQLPQQRDQAVAFSGKLDVDSGDSDSVLSTQVAEFLPPQRPHLEVEDSLQDALACILGP